MIEIGLGHYLTLAAIVFTIGVDTRALDHEGLVEGGAFISFLFARKRISKLKVDRQVEPRTCNKQVQGVSGFLLRTS